MTHKQLADEFQKILKEHGYRAFLIGSVAAGTNRKDSDIDFVLPLSGITRAEFFSEMEQYRRSGTDEITSLIIPESQLDYIKELACFDSVDYVGQGKAVVWVKEYHLSYKGIRIDLFQEMPELWRGGYA